MRGAGTLLLACLAVAVVFQRAGSVALPAPGAAREATTDSAGWMGALNATLASKRLRDIRWPGAHDAGTGAFGKPYVIVNDRPMNGGIFKAWKYLRDNPLFPWLAAILADRIAILGQAQPFAIGHQLGAGARYFDCRLFKQTDGTVALTHTVVGQAALSVAADVRAHLRANPGELVILHERQREGFADLGDYTRFLADFTQAMGGDGVLVPANATWTSTYGELVAPGRTGRVIYVMCHEGTHDPPCQALGAPAGKGLFWSSDTTTSMWPNAQDSATIQTKFDKQMATWGTPAYNHTLCIAQLVFSPTDKQYVEWAILDDSLQKESKDLRAALPGQIAGWAAQPPTAAGVNVLMYDFVSDSATMQAIIALNAR